MKFNVTDIEFDYKDSKLTFAEEIEIRDLALGVYEADNDDDLMDEITAAVGHLFMNDGDYLFLFCPVTRAFFPSG